MSRKINKKHLAIDRMPKIPLGTKIHKSKKEKEPDLDSELFKCSMCNRWVEIDEVNASITEKIVCTECEDDNLLRK